MELFHFDIETVGSYKDYNDLLLNDKRGADLFLKKFNKMNWVEKYDDIDSAYINNAGIISTFGKIICISSGYINNNGSVSIGSYFGDNEVDIINDFNNLDTSSNNNCENNNNSKLNENPFLNETRNRNTGDNNTQSNNFDQGVNMDFSDRKNNLLSNYNNNYGHEFSDKKHTNLDIDHQENYDRGDYDTIKLKRSEANSNTPENTNYMYNNLTSSNFLGDTSLLNNNQNITSISKKNDK